MILELSLLSELGAAWVTFQAAAAGLSVGAAAATGAAFVVCTAATIHNIYVGVKIVNAVVDAAKDKTSEDAGKEGTSKKIKKLGKPKPIMCLMIITRRMNKPKNTDIKMRMI